MLTYLWRWNFKKDFEDCEDENDEQFDGCFECKFQCQQNCEICEQGKCLREICPDGKYLKEDQCQSVCGDKIITDDEQCDDGNETQFDGCYDCQYQCNQHCVFCEIGVCIECTRDYALINGLCILNEQNAIKIIESFDKNDPKSKEAILDGNEICNQFECSFSKQPNMKLTFRQQQFSLQYIDISFDQQIKFRDQIIKQKSSFNISINDLDPKDYNITINPIQDISFDLQYAYQSREGKLNNFIYIQQKN